MMWNGDGWGWGAVMMIVFLALLLLLVWGLLRTAPPTPRGSRERDAEDILAERFARGEIDQEEYERRRAVLARPRR